MSWERMIGHVDMDSFYASVEIRDDPSLAGRPVVVGGEPGKRGVVSSASYRAREFGVRSAMPMSRALRLCPDLVVLRGDMRKYRAASRILRRILGEISPRVEPLSLDEAFLDLTGGQRLLGDARRIGEAVRRRIRGELSLTASVGISTSKFVAKLASDYRKPDGLTVVPPGEVERFVQSLPLERLWGAGPATVAVLRREGIRTMAALAAADGKWLGRRLGANAERLVRLARGVDDRPVVPDSPARSISHEVTFPRDLRDDGVLEGVLLGLAEKVARRARRAGVSGGTVVLKLRLPDFTTRTRSRKVTSPTRETSEIYGVARELFHSLDRKGESVRLLGVGITGLTDSPQLELDLFGDAAHETGPGEERRRLLQEAEDAIVERFGRNALSRARTLLAEETPAPDSAASPRTAPR